MTDYVIVGDAYDRPRSRCRSAPGFIAAEADCSPILSELHSTVLAFSRLPENAKSFDHQRNGCFVILLQMRTLLTTHKSHPRDSFRFWQNAVFERIVPVELKRIGDRPFEGLLEGMDAGPVLMTRVTQSPVRTEATTGTIRRHDKHETISVVIMLSGTLTCTQNGREAVQRPGEFVVLDRRPTIMETEVRSRSIILEIPRERLERMLGPTTLYACLTMGAEQSATSLVTNFFSELIRMEGQLSRDTAERMASIGVDLLVASIAERLAKEAPKPLAGTILIQRARAYVEDNLGDPTLDPPQLAIAMGVSLRRLQQLFREHDRNIAAWIWQRRLEVAAVKLADPGFVHLSIGALSYGCGFIDQAHFSRRFKGWFGMTPSEYRESAVRTRFN